MRPARTILIMQLSNSRYLCMYISRNICYNSRVSIQDLLYADPTFIDTKG